ncbi:hypothetical protein JYU34_001237 [Plutella xylostella]|uniref:Transposase n=1 Tax=Plutella xylostella TaxID=51655 RepID=A0ABQ7R6G4_PLUXY|nr:hypothetical protein JYU34_001237 [Plutella xylostella]
MLSICIFCLQRRTVQLWVHRYADLGHVDSSHRGRKPTTTYTDASPRHREIVAAHSADPFCSTRSTATTHNISLQTVRVHLRAAGLRCRRPAKKIALTDQHRRNRVRFATDYLNFDWCNNVVIFSDEKSFKSDKDGRKILWRKSGERYKETNILQCRSSGRITLGYWGWMSSMGPGELVEVGANNNSQGYLEVLRHVLLPTVRVAYPDSHIYFVHDNCAIHRARIVQDWLNTQDSLTVIEWPSKSPDLNPIENLWGHMTLNWDPSEVRSKANLDNVVTATWESIRGTDVCWNMVNGMRNRLQQVIDNDGAPISY